MKFIAHRGNTAGPNPELENRPEYILTAAEKYDVEIDVWFVDGKYMLGHDMPTYEVPLSFLRNSRLWCHAKNLETLCELLRYSDIICFGHNIDDGVLTSNNFIWTYPGKDITARSIAVMPELSPGWNYSMAYAYCSDYVIYGTS